MAIVTKPLATAKRAKPTHHHQHRQPLLPGLPDHIAHLCLSRLPPRLLYSVCRSWRLLISSPSYPAYPSLYALLTTSSPTNTSPISLRFSSFDPISSTWHFLPPPPHQTQILLRHPSFISRHLPIQSLSLDGHLILLAATAHPLVPALTRPLVYHPPSNLWRLGPPVPAPRRWCVAGSARGAVYLASGIGAEYSASVARSAERWNLKQSNWEPVASLKDGRFSREAVEAVCSMGKLFMVNVKGKAIKEGAVYDVESDVWEEMRDGLVAGWNGPAAAMDEREIYVVDEVKGALMVYDWGMDCWTEVIVSEVLRGATQVAAGGGRVCVVCDGGLGVAVVDVVARPVGIWVVEPPPETQVVALHVLPRTSLPAG